MSSQSKLLGVLAVLLAAAAAAFFLWFQDPADPDGGAAGDTEGVNGAANALSGDPTRTGKAGAGTDIEGGRAALAQDPDSIIGVRGVVLDVKTRAPLAGVEVVALRMMPSLERPITRFTSMFREGLWTDTSKPVKILGSAITQGDGSFEMFGLPPGRVYLDARSDRAFIRNPGNVRLAKGQIAEGIELLASPGGRIVGQVFGPEGNPAKNTRVSVRPGLNSFLGQLTQRKYKWLEAMTDEEGRFVIAGVPTGDGYSVTIAAPEMALEERHGVDVALGQTVEMTIRGKIGANVTGRAIDQDGNPVPNAQVAMVYLDISRMVFSADGRDEPIRTDENGYFQLPHVAPGRVAFIAATDALAPSNIHELAVVDGGVYTDIVLTLDKGRSFRGTVVDGDDNPVPGADVVIRPMNFGGDDQRGADAMKMALTIRRVVTKTDAQGQFETHGIAGKRMSMQFSKPGFITITKRWEKVDQKDFKIVLTKGVTIRGRVKLADGKPVTRFRVRTRSKLPKPKDAKGKAEASGDDHNVRVEFRAGRGGRVRRGGPRGRRGDFMRGTSRRREGAGEGGRGRDWDEVKNRNGVFTIRGLPHGEISVDVRADGFLDPEGQKVTLEPGGVSGELEFVVDPGAVASGIVRDAATGRPVAETTVTAYKVKKEKKRTGLASLFQNKSDPEDFDFLGMASGNSQRSAMTDSKGHFTIKGLKPGDYRFTGRHPDMAKASVTDVSIALGQPTDNIEILLTAGGAIEGIVTGKGKLPLGNAMVVAFSLQAGSFKSDATDERGYYKIDGLPKGQYIVFKSKMNERSQDIGMDLMSNMRLKTTTVRANKVTRRDIHDEAEGSVRVYGVVRDAGKPVKRSVITMLGRDRDGILGMGIRTKPTEPDGSYEILGVQPGEYLVQIARFRNRAEQSSLTVEIPEGVREFRWDINMPQSYIAGVVQDSSGNPVPNVQVQVGLQEDSPVPGLVGIMLRNGLGQARTNEAGEFKIQGLAEGLYRVTAGSAGATVRQRGVMPRVRANGQKDKKWGQVAKHDIQLDGLTPHEGLVLILPQAGQITGIVVDGAGNPVQGASIIATSEERQMKLAERRERALTDLFGLQAQPTKSGADGRFTIEGVTPGTYRVRAEYGELAPGQRENVAVLEGQPTELRLEVIKGATLKLRVRNISGENLPIANISVLDSKGRSIASNVSVMSVFLKYMKGRKKKDSSGWHEIGGIRPDTYTIIIKEKGQPDMKIVKTVKDGEEARWDIDMSEELSRHKNSKK